MYIWSKDNSTTAPCIQSQVSTAAQVNPGMTDTEEVVNEKIIIKSTYKGQAQHSAIHMLHAT